MQPLNYSLDVSGEEYSFTIVNVRVNTIFNLQYFSINLRYQILIFNVTTMKENIKGSLYIFSLLFLLLSWYLKELVYL